jgi:hypothetical protein
MVSNDVSTQPLRNANYSLFLVLWCYNGWDGGCAAIINQFKIKEADT